MEEKEMAGYIPDELIAEITAANDIVDIASSYMKLKRTGSGYTGLCPFHGEKTPSFHISPDKQLYHCFGCGAGGSVLQFIMNIENLDFVDAVKFLAAKANIAIPKNPLSNNSNFSLSFPITIYRYRSHTYIIFHIFITDNLGFHNHAVIPGNTFHNIINISG